MEDMKADVERAESQVKTERDAISKLAERLAATSTRERREYKEMEEELAKRQADLAVAGQLQKNEFLQREAKIYHNVYQEILQATDYFCQAERHRHGAALQRRAGRRATARQRVDVHQQAGGLVRSAAWTSPTSILQDVNRTAANPGRGRSRAAAQPASPFNGNRR